MSYHHIVVGTDFSLQSSKILDEGIRLASRYGARLSILHVIDDHLSRYWEFLPMSPPDMEESILQEVRKKLNQQLDEYTLPSMQSEAHVLLGRPYQEILRYCQEEHADLIVVGQRNASLLKRLLLGSTAENLLHHATAQLLVLRAGKNPGFHRILAPVDFSPTSRNALNKAIQLCKEEQAELHVAHIFEDTPMASFASLLPVHEVTEMTTSIEQQVRQDLDSFLHSIDFQGAPYHAHFRRGTPFMEIAVMAEELACDLLVMGSVGRTGLSNLIVGNTAERVARSLPCSLLAVRPQA